MHLSKEFFELLKAIGESKSKQEEDRIIQREITTLKKKLETGNTGGGGMGSKLQTMKNVGGGGPGSNGLNQSRKKSKEFLVRLLYVGKLLMGAFTHIPVFKCIVSTVCHFCLSLHSQS